MHNRVRLIAASFLTKHLGARLARRRGVVLGHAVRRRRAPTIPRTGNGSPAPGADAAPYFRVFNPMLQGEKFDPDGAYVRRWVPELAGSTTRHIHAPWKAPEAALDAAGVKLGRDYPAPIVDHDRARARALAAYRRNRRRDGSAHAEGAEKREEQRIRQRLREPHQRRPADAESGSRSRRAQARRRSAGTPRRIPSGTASDSDCPPSAPSSRSRD